MKKNLARANGSVAHLRDGFNSAEAGLRAIAVELWQMYKKDNRATGEKVAGLLGCSVANALMLLRAGRLLSEPKLNDFLCSIQATIYLMAKLHVAIMRLHRSSHYLRDLHKFLLEVDGGSEDTYLRHVTKRVSAINSVAKKEKEEEKRVEEAKRREALEEMDRERWEADNAPPMMPRPLYGLSRQELRESMQPQDLRLSQEEIQERVGLPKFRAAYGTVFYDVVERGDNDNLLCLSGLTDMEAAVVTNAIRNYVPQVEDLRKPEREVMGDAAKLFLADKASRQERADRITLTTVTYASELANEDAVFYGPGGLKVDAEQLLSAASQFKVGTRQIVVDHQGRVISDFEGRLAPATCRDWHQVESNKCYLCDKPLRLEEHHVEPWAQGGETSYDNLIPLCPHCHPRVEENPASLAIYYDLGCAVFEDRDGNVRASVLSAEGGSIIRAIACQLGMDISDKASYWALRRALEKQARRRYREQFGL